MSSFSFGSYVEENLDRVRMTTGGELTATCPWCGKYGSFYVNENTGNYICFKCEKRGRHLIGIVAYVEGVSWGEAKRIVLRRSIKFRRKGTPLTLLESIRRLRYGDEFKDSKKSLVNVDLPDEYKPIYNPETKRYRFPLYLRDRGIKKKVAREWRIGYCDKGRYAGRVIIPIECPNGRSFLARDATGEHRVKILNPPGADHGRLVIGWPFMIFGADLAIVEGPFDAIKWYQHGINVLALGGKVLHPEQRKLLFGLPRDIAITIALDPEEIEAPFTIASSLSSRFDEIFISKLPPGVDPGDSTKKQALSAYERAFRYTGRRGFLKQKLKSVREKTERIYK